LRAIGFGGGAIVISIFAEVLILAMAGALIGTAAAWTIFNGRLYAGGIILFDLAVTPTQVAIGMVWALVVGVIGGLFPALRAARLPVATALQVR
jgi:putative ABC transport system permease protein